MIHAFSPAPCRWSKQWPRWYFVIMLCDSAGNAAEPAESLPTLRFDAKLHVGVCRDGRSIGVAPPGLL